MEYGKIKGNVLHLSARRILLLDKERRTNVILKQCSRCKAVVPYPKRYCDDCAKIVTQENIKGRMASSKRYNTVLDKGIKNFYKSSQWQLFRIALLEERGYKCEDCGAIAVDVHHVKHLDTSEGWERRLDVDNCKILCIKCHNFQHKRFGKYPQKSTGG